MKLLRTIGAAFPGGALAPEDSAPSFSATADDGRTVCLEDFAGRTLILFFYPRDFTSG